MAERHSGKSVKFSALQGQFASALPERLQNIFSLWEQARELQSNDRWDEMLRQVHSLAGSAATFGFPRLGEQALVLESVLQQAIDSQLTAEEVAHIDEILGQMKAIARSGPEVAVIDDLENIGALLAKGHSEEDRKLLVYLIEDDEVLAEELARQLEYFGYTTQQYTRAEDLLAAVAEVRPDALLVDIHLPEGATAGTDIVAHLHAELASDLPVIFISAYDTWEGRLNAVRAGGQAFIAKPINLDELVAQLDTVSGKPPETPYRILIVDDSQLLAEHYAAILEAAAMEVLIVNEPSLLLDTLAKFIPDLILMDLHMPDCNGVEVANVIRQQLAYVNLPIVYLSIERGLQPQVTALRAGADDFLQKPISAAHLIASVSFYAQRFRQLTALMTRDSLTGLLNHINMKLALEREVTRAQRQHGLLSFVMLDLDRFKAINDRYGHPVGDRVIVALARLLKNRLRKVDIAARYGGEEFAVIMPDTTAQQAQSVIDELRNSFSKIPFNAGSDEFFATFSAGVASLPPCGSLDDLIADTDSALYSAKKTGRNQIFINTEL